MINIDQELTKRLMDEVEPDQRIVAYNKETEDRNIGEVIIAKQRNGPLGTVKLAWLSEYTTFANLARDTGPAADAPF